MVENPNTWGPLEHAIADALHIYEEARAKKKIGGSKVYVIAEHLRKLGLVNELGEIKGKETLAEKVDREFG